MAGTSLSRGARVVLPALVASFTVGLASTCSILDLPDDTGTGNVPKPGDCKATSRPCNDWRCAKGMTMGGFLETPTDPFEGTYLDQTSSAYDFATVRVEALPGGGAKAVYRTPNGCELTSTVTSHDEATLDFGGVTVDGLGEPTEAEKQALAALGASRLIDALVTAPLDVGCNPTVPPAYEAALLFPWQVLLKYDPVPATRIDDLKTLASASQCKYFTERRADDASGSKMGPMRLSNDHPFPAVFAFFPLDEAGATEHPGQPLEGDLTGPCGAKCRGACGEDCARTNCKEIINYKCETLPDGGTQGTELVTEDCGVHDGCVEHDNCYDDCNRTHGCGKFRSALCKRGCDKAAGDKWGFDNGYEWAQGFGPFMRQVKFTWTRPGSSHICAGCVAPGTPVRMADGTERPIEEVRSGDAVYAYDFERGVPAEARVEALWVHGDADYPLQQLSFSGGQTLQVTGNHPVWVVGHGYRPVDELQPGDKVLVANATVQAVLEETVISIVRRHATSGVVYNLQTSRHHYFAADVLIHNKCLAAGARVDTPSGPVAVEALRPGQWVWGDERGERVATQVRAVYRKATILPNLPGKQLAPGLAVTVNHEVGLGVGSGPQRFVPAGSLPATDVAIPGEVFDLETDTGNYYAAGRLLRAATP